MKNKIKRIFKYVAVPFKDKFKLQRRCNTLELEKAELEMIIQSRITETIMNILENQAELQRVNKENKRLRLKNKELKNELKGETK